MALVGKGASIVISIITKADDSSKKITDAASRYDKLAASASKVAKPAAAVAVAVVAGAKLVGDAASRQEQALGAVDAVFGKSAGQIRAWSDQAATSAGLSKAEYGEFASTVGAQLQNLGVSQGEAASSTDKLIKLGGDLAAQFGGSSSAAVGALSAALRGEADPAERYGLSLSKTAINAELAAKGQDKLTGSAATTAKAQAVLALATKQAAGANGAFAREANTAAGSQAIANAQFQNAAAQLGQAVLPIMVALSGVLSSVAGWMSRNAVLVTALAAVIGVLAGAVLLINGYFKLAAAASLLWSLANAKSAVATGTATTAQVLFNAAILANPIGLFVVAILAAVAAIVYLWRNNEGFRDFVLTAWAQIQAVALVVWDAIKAAGLAIFNVLKAVVAGYVAYTRGFFTVLFAVVRGVFTGIGAVGSAIFRALAAVVSAHINVIRAVLSALGAAAGAVWNVIRSGGAAAFNGLRAVASGAMAGVRAVLSALGAAAGAVWRGIQAGASLAGRVIAPVRSALDFVFSLVGRVVGAISSIRFPSPPAWLSSLFGGGGGSGGSGASSYAAQFVGGAGGAGVPAAAVYAASSPTLPRSWRRAPGGSGGGDQVTIYAMDGDSAARALERLQTRGRRRAGGVLAGYAVNGLRA